MSEKGSEHRSRRERRAAERAVAKQAPKPRKDFDPSRRKFLIDAAKVITPGGWIPDAREKGLAQLSTSARISLAKDLVFSGGLTALVGQELTRDKTFKEKAEAFTWEDARDPEKLREYVNLLADKYLSLTKTGIVRKSDLTSSDKLHFFKNTTEFAKALKSQPPDSQWGFANYDTGEVFIDLQNLEDLSLGANHDAGTALIDSLWHEWGHLDVAPRLEGELINNSTNPYARIKTSQGTEVFREYRGGEVFTDTHRAFRRFEEVLNETITLRRIFEEVGLTRSFSSSEYYQNGTDFFRDFTITAGISLNELYAKHSTSDFEGLAILAGSNLPGEKDPLYKGLDLFDAISQNRRDLVERTGVFTRIPRK